MTRRKREAANEASDWSDQCYLCEEMFPLYDDPYEYKYGPTDPVCGKCSEERRKLHADFLDCREKCSGGEDGKWMGKCL